MIITCSSSRETGYWGKDAIQTFIEAQERHDTPQLYSLGVALSSQWGETWAASSVLLFGGALPGLTFPVAKVTERTGRRHSCLPSSLMLSWSKLPYSCPHFSEPRQVLWGGWNSHPCARVYTGSHTHSTHQLLELQDTTERKGMEAAGLHTGLPLSSYSVFPLIQFLFPTEWKWRKDRRRLMLPHEGQRLPLTDIIPTEHEWRKGIIRGKDWIHFQSRPNLSFFVRNDTIAVVPREHVSF